jgi:hypothetical protein
MFFHLCDFFQKKFSRCDRICQFTASIAMPPTIREVQALPEMSGGSAKKIGAPFN